MVTQDQDREIPDRVAGIREIADDMTAKARPDCLDAKRVA
jgi:hypothetical protein